MMSVFLNDFKFIKTPYDDRITLVTLSKNEFKNEISGKNLLR